MSRKSGSLAEEVARWLSLCENRDGCLVLPTRSLNRYAQIRYNRGEHMRAHRASYVVHHGPIPEGLEVRHTCDNPPCVNPDHLLIGTRLDNERDKWERGRGAFGLRIPSATASPETVRDAVSTYLRGGVSQAEMARRVGVAQSTFGRWVRAESRRDSGLSGVSVGKGSRIGTGLGAPSGQRLDVGAALSTRGAVA